MPRNFFDVTDTGDSSGDSEGVEFPSLKEARVEALRTLGEIAKDELRDGDRRDLVIRIREKSGTPILSVTLTLRVETHEPNCRTKSLLSRDRAPFSRMPNTRICCH